MVPDARARLGFDPEVADVADVCAGDFPVVCFAETPDDGPADGALCAVRPRVGVRREDLADAILVREGGFTTLRGRRSAMKACAADLLVNDLRSRRPSLVVMSACQSLFLRRIGMCHCF